jgi:hypothetical protein
MSVKTPGRTSLRSSLRFELRLAGQPSLPSFAWLRRTGGSFRLLPHCGIRRDKSARQGQPRSADKTLLWTTVPQVPLYRGL